MTSCVTHASIIIGIIWTIAKLQALLPIALETRPPKTMKTITTDVIDVTLTLEAALMIVIIVEIVIKIPLLETAKVTTTTPTRTDILACSCSGSFSCISHCEVNTFYYIHNSKNWRTSCHHNISSSLPHRKQSCSPPQHTMPLSVCAELPPQPKSEMFATDDVAKPTKPNECPKKLQRFSFSTGSRSLKWLVRFLLVCIRVSSWETYT